MPSEDGMAMKREEVKEGEGDYDKSLSSMLQPRKKNPTNAATQTTKSRPKDTKNVKKEDPLEENVGFDNKPVKGKVKKEEPPFENGDFDQPIKGKVKKEDGDDDYKPISSVNSSAKANNKELNKKKKKKVEEKKGPATTVQNGRKKEKKVYDLPGQKRDPPEERDPLRIFYETLYEQLPNSEMAQIWMMESGLLSKEEAKKVYEKKQKKNQQNLTSPRKTVATAKKIQSATVEKKKTLSSAVSSAKRKATASKDLAKQSKKRKIEEGSSEDVSDEDYLGNCRTKKKHRAS